MNAHSIFDRLAKDIVRMGLAHDEQRAGETVTPTPPPRVDAMREATPIPHLYGHAGQEL